MLFKTPVWAWPPRSPPTPTARAVWGPRRVSLSRADRGTGAGVDCALRLISCSSLCQWGGSPGRNAAAGQWSEE